MIKLVYCLKRKSGMSFEEFSTYWHEKHAALVPQFTEVLNIKKYTQSHTIQSSLGKPMAGTGKSVEGYDGVAELWFDSIEDFLAGATSEEGMRAFVELRADEEKFIDRENSVLWLCEEKCIVG